MEDFINKSKSFTSPGEIRLNNIIKLNKLGGKILCRLNTYMHPIPKLSNKLSAPIFLNQTKPISPSLPPRF